MLGGVKVEVASRCVQLLQQGSPPLLQLPFAQLAAGCVPAALNTTRALSPAIATTTTATG